MSEDAEKRDDAEKLHDIISIVAYQVDTVAVWGDRLVTAEQVSRWGRDKENLGAPLLVCTMFLLGLFVAADEVGTNELDVDTAQRAGAEIMSKLCLGLATAHNLRVAGVTEEE